MYCWRSVGVLYTSVLGLTTQNSIFYLFISIIGTSWQKLEAPLTLSLAPGASIGENTVVYSGA